MNRFKIPTILGLGIILLGLTSGLFLVLRQQVFLSQAAPDVTAQNITISNISDDSAVISWQTNAAASAYVSYGQNSAEEQISFDDLDIGGAQPRLTHYITLKNLLPQTHYQFKIVVSKISSELKKFETAKPMTNKTTLSPLIGTVMDGDMSLNDGIVYLIINGATIQSALVKTGGSFLIPLNNIRKEDLSDVYPITDNLTAKILVASDKGPANLLFNIKTISSPLAPIKIGQNIDLTVNNAEQKSIFTESKYDLNKDGKINSADYAIISACIDKKLSTALSAKELCGQADVNQDSKINQQDLDLMSGKLKDSVSR